MKLHLRDIYPLIFLGCGMMLVMVSVLNPKASSEDKVSIRGSTSLLFGVAATMLIPGGGAASGAIAPFSQVAIKNIDNSKDASEEEGNNENEEKPKG